MLNGLQKGAETAEICWVSSLVGATTNAFSKSKKYKFKKDIHYMECSTASVHYLWNVYHNLKSYKNYFYSP